MNILTLIEKKKQNKTINEQEFDWFIKNILNKSIQDYQISAFLMSIWFSKLNFNETYYLTKAIIENGKSLSFPKEFNEIIDKHSTGGVGDKVSLVLLPILASLNIKIAKISGRGLGYTGGTIDKLDSINCNTSVNDEKIIELMRENGFFIIQQTSEIVPADKILYAIRDTSGSVDNISLIAASIMSKKIATNADYIYLDVKVGDGAFFATLKDAKDFGELCIKLGKKFKKKVIVHYTDMNKPLGRCLGNLIEVKESIDFLNGKYHCKYLKELIFEFAADVLLDLKKCKSKKEAYEMIENTIKNKNAYNKFLDFAKAQESSFDFDNLLNNNYSTNFKIEIKAQHDGYVNFKSNRELGMSLIDLKAGRKQKTDELDFLSGLYLNKYNGELVKKGDVIVSVYSSEQITNETINKIKSNIEICVKKPIIKKTILGISKNE